VTGPVRGDSAHESLQHKDERKASGKQRAAGAGRGAAASRDIVCSHQQRITSINLLECLGAAAKWRLAD